MFELRNNPIDPAAELKRLQSECQMSGAIVSFTGVVRAFAEDEAVEALHLDAHPTLTLKLCEAALNEARSRWLLDNVLAIHRIGEMIAGDVIVFVGTASKHRRASFEAADFLMDYLKSRAPFWKKEIRGDGAHWIEPREQDYQDADRWTLQEH